MSRGLCLCSACTFSCLLVPAGYAGSLPPVTVPLATLGTVLHSVTELFMQSKVAQEASTNVELVELFKTNNKAGRTEGRYGSYEGDWASERAG